MTLRCSTVHAYYSTLSWHEAQSLCDAVPAENRQLHWY